MDPDAALNELRELINKHGQGVYDGVDIDRMVELIDGLDEWLQTGGFLPKDWQRDG